MAKNHQSKKGKSPKEKAKAQAKNVLADMRASGIDVPRGSGRGYGDNLKQLALHMNQVHGKSLRGATVDDVTQFLVDKAVKNGQSSLNIIRQAAERMLRFTGQLGEVEKLQTIYTEKHEVLKSRAYSPEQIEAIAARQTEKHALATLVANEAGLRAHEMLNIARIDEINPHVRRSSSFKFAGREDTVAYVVKGKGGLKREIRLSHSVSERLEARRLEKPRFVMDREIRYTQRYDIGGGKRWSDSFSAASKRALGFSNGAHGCRHSYAQRRMDALTVGNRVEYEAALEAVSQELGHLRPGITKVYLR